MSGPIMWIPIETFPQMLKYCLLTIFDEQQDICHQ